MVRRYLSIAMIVLLVVCWSVPSFAYEATPSNLEELSMEDYLKNYKKIPLSLDNPGLGVVPDASVHTSSDSDIWIGDDGLLVADSDDMSNLWLIFLGFRFTIARRTGLIIAGIVIIYLIRKSFSLWRIFIRCE